MEISDFLKGIRNCCCGRDHDCPIESVIIGKGAISSLSDLVKNFKSILLVADENTYDVCGSSVTSELGDRLVDTLIFKRDGVLVPDEVAIGELEARVTADIDLIVGVGSGVINDLCKIVSYNHSLPYFIVATAPSMDGYASRGSALILNGMKVTLNADVPRAIIADTDVLANSPFSMIQAGFGDIIGKYSCLNDWRLSAIVNGEYICERVVSMTYEVLEKTVLERFEKYKHIEENEVKYEEYLTEDADIVLVAYGITARIAKTAVRNARTKGIKAGLFRPITLYPFPKKELNALADKASCFLSVEMNMGQMVNDIKLAINCKKDVYHYGRTGGMIPSPEEILAKIEEISGGNA